MPETKPKQKTVSPRVSAAIHKWLSENFKTPNAGAEWSIETMHALAQSRVVREIAEARSGPQKIEGALTWATEELPLLIQHTIAYELRGKLTGGELYMILDVLNVHDPKIPGKHIVQCVRDSFEIYPGVYELKWDVEKSHMLSTLEALTIFQLAALEYWAAMFREVDFNAQDTEKHCAILEVAK